MNVSEVMDIDSTGFNSTKLEVGDKITIQKMNVKKVESIGEDVAEFKTVDGERHSFAKTIVGQARSEKWNDLVEKCVEKDASDGLNAWVVEKTAEGTGRPMLALSWFPPKP